MERSLPLEGVKIVEFSHVQAGPICGMMLADMGAEVIKVESFSGDMYRAPLDGCFFDNFNRNKKSISIDLKTKKGIDIAEKLILEADVLLENYRPGALARLGLCFDRVKKINPKIIYA